MRPRPAVLGLATATLVLAAAGATQAHDSQRYRAKLEPVNSPDARGVVELEREGSHLEVMLRARGLDDGTHVAHIHGFAQAEAECPMLSDDTDGNGLVDLLEGLPRYGPVLRTLSRAGDTGTRLRYERMFATLDNGQPVSSLGRLDRYAIVVHGVDLDGDGVASNPDVGGDSVTDHDDNELSMPALCGEIVAR